MKLFGWMLGPIEFYDSDANFVMTANIWWFIDHNENHCREHGVPVNKKLYL